MIQKSKVKSYINSHGLSVSAQSYDHIERLFAELLDQVVANVVDDNMKTVMPHHCVQQIKTVVQQTPQDGSNLKPQFYQWAKTVQEFCADQAVILSREVKG